jgi:hydrogenase-4 component D
MNSIMVALLVVPFAGAVVCGLIPRGAKALAGLVAAATAALAIAAVAQTYPDSWGMQVGGLPWLPGRLNQIALFGVLLDPMSSIVLLVATVLGLGVVLFSSEYVSGANQDQPYVGGDNRYYFWLLSCLGAMIGLALSPNLLQMFVFWEMTTVCSWAMISHAHTEITQRAGMKALIIKHVGGMGFLIALALLFVTAGDFGFGALAQVSTGMAAAVFMLLLVAAWAKAAQFPFHTWLPDSMEAPTPVNAFLDAAALVNASILLLARVLTASWHAPAGLAVVVAVMAMVSIFMAIMSYFRQDDLKRLLAYSTIAHLGYMMIGVALGIWGSQIGFRGALLHVLSHGVAKTTLFLAVGAIAYGAGTRRISELQGIAGRMPLEATAFMVGVVAVTGVPPFATFWSKFMIFAGALESPAGIVLLALLATESVVSFAWLLWIAHRVFLGQPSPAAVAAVDAPPWMSVALVIGMVLCLAAPLVGLPLVGRIVP